MYEDSWYSFVPDAHGKQEDGHSQKTQHRRRESLLKQPNDGDHISRGRVDPLVGLFEESSSARNPPEATLARRAKSYSDFYTVARAQLTKDVKRIREKEREGMIPTAASRKSPKFISLYEEYEDELLDSSQEGFEIYRDQLNLSKRHLDGLLQDTTSALDLLANLSGSFQSVEIQTTAFQEQCEDLLAEKRHMKSLSEEVGAGLQYYTFLEPITRRLNAPGASTVIGDEGFVELLAKLDACIDFMIRHPSHRESDIYLTRYKSLLARTLNLIENMFSKALRDSAAEAKRSETLRRQVGEKLTMTTVFLYQAPESDAEIELLKKSLQHLVEKANLVLDSGAQKLSDQYKIDFRSYFAIYEDTLKTLILAYVSYRFLSVPEIIETLLLQIIASDIDPTADFLRYARECLNSVLEIGANETIKFLTVFANSWSLMKYQDQPSSILLSIEKGAFKEFLNTMASKVFDILQTHIQNNDISAVVEFATWLNSYVYYRNPSNELVSLQSDEDGEEEEANDISTRAKSRVAGEINNKIITTIFGRIREILLRDVERYVPKSDDLIFRGVTSQPDAIGKTSSEDGLFLEDGINARLEKALGPGILEAYPPVTVATRLLVYINDLTFEYNGQTLSSEIAYEILHQTCAAITRAATQVAAKFTPLDGRIFAVKNLVILKNLVLAYEIAGSRRASVLDFTDVWATFTELRIRGGLFDIASYYNLLTSGNLLPKVVENVQDARVELDGLLRENITIFREESAKMILKERSGGKKGVVSAEEQIKKKLAASYPQELKLQESLWDAVVALVREKKEGQ